MVPVMTPSLPPGVMGVARSSGQATRRWNTRPASGMRSASAAACAKLPSGPRVSSPGTRISTAPPATRINLPLAVSSVIRSSPQAV